jgi:type II secretory pathway pseudopilin PulG
VTQLRDEGGFSLIELQVVIVLMIIVLGAVLTTFNESEATQRVNQDQNDAQSQNRRAVDAIVRQLRNLASPSTSTPQAVEKSDPYDLVFQVVAATRPAVSPNANARNIKRVRYCLGDSTGGKATLWRQEQTWTSSTPPTIPSTVSCPDAAWPTIPNASGNARAVAEHLVNRERAVSIFTANTTDLASVNAFRIEVLVDVNPGRSPIESRLSSGVFLRNQNRAPIANATAIDTGTGHRVLLNGSGSEDPEGSALSEYEWFADGNMTTPIATGPVAYWESPGPFPKPHTFTLRVTDAGGRQGLFTTPTVTVN